MSGKVSGKRVHCVLWPTVGRCPLSISPCIPPPLFLSGKACFRTATIFQLQPWATSASRLSPAAVDHRHTNWPWFSLPCFKCTLLCVLRGAAMSVRSFPTGSLGHYLNEVLPLEVGEHMLTVRYWFVGYFKWWYLCLQSRKEKNISGELLFIIRLNDLQDNDIFGDNTFHFHKVRKYGYTL